MWKMLFHHELDLFYFNEILLIKSSETSILISYVHMTLLMKCGENISYFYDTFFFFLLNVHLTTCDEIWWNVCYTSVIFLCYMCCRKVMKCSSDLLWWNLMKCLYIMYYLCVILMSYAVNQLLFATVYWRLTGSR